MLIIPTQDYTRRFSMGKIRGNYDKIILTYS